MDILLFQALQIGSKLIYFTLENNARFVNVFNVLQKTLVLVSLNC